MYKFIYQIRIPMTFFFVFAQFSVFSNGLNHIQNTSRQEYKQWFTGPIITPNPTTVPPGHPGLELDLIATKNYGFYDSQGKVNRTPTIWGIQPLFDFQVGFNRILGAELIGSMVTNSCKGESSTRLADSIFRLGFQVSIDKEGSWIPDFRILLQETFPTGKYQKLSLKKRGADSTGQGSFQTGVQCVFQKAFCMNKSHSFRLRGSIGYFVPSAVVVKGLNCYGGDTNTKGTIYLGNYYTGFLYGEYALSRTWAFACELNYQQGENGKFTKMRGPKIQVPSFNQLSVLPEIQHTYSENLGIIFGGWFTVSGRNSSAFGKIFGAVLFLF
ncbi:MAG: hypothetical protein JSS61_05980 [Verrucomicrobia bacterium]|nr:hypothetical protein [Verrucomicrobiota bacterium]